MNTVTSRITFALALLGPVFAGAETVKDREGAVRQDKATMENDPRWIYNDVERGFAEAKKANKPLLVVLRCVPCLSCAGIDAQVIEEGELQPLLDQFVRVRLINANNLDLSRFQFDFDLSFSTLFFNGDGTVYGRYGSWTHQKNPQDKTVAGFKKALEGALETHKGYPRNKSVLTGKQGAPFPFKTPLEMPNIAGKYGRDLNWDGKVVQSCVHCHQIGDALRFSFRDQKKPIPEEWIYPFPMPETIGISLVPEHAARIASVSPGSLAAKAALQPGDDLITLGGQPLFSHADVSWALHRAPSSGNLEFVIQRGQSQTKSNLPLPPNWRKASDISRRVATWPMRAMAFGGMLLEDLSDEERSRRNLSKDSLALYVKHVGEYGKHAAAKKAGFLKEDVITEIEGVSGRVTEGMLIGHLIQKHQAGERVKAVALRKGEKVDLMLPIQ